MPRTWLLLTLMNHATADYYDTDSILRLTFPGGSGLGGTRSCWEMKPDGYPPLFKRKNLPLRQNVFERSERKSDEWILLLPRFCFLVWELSIVHSSAMPSRQLINRKQCGSYGSIGTPSVYYGFLLIYWKKLSLGSANPGVGKIYRAKPEDCTMRSLSLSVYRVLQSIICHYMIMVI